MTHPHLAWLAGTTCPHCDTTIDTCQSSSPGQRTVPEDGDAHLCLGCAEFSFFQFADGKATLRPATRLEKSVLVLRFVETWAKVVSFAPKRRRE